MSKRKNQRLYLMQNSMNLSKIGIAINPELRKRQLELASGTTIDIIKCWETLDSDAYTVEQALHVMYSRRRKSGEWFTHISISDIEYAGWELRQCNTNGTQRRIR